MDDRYYNNVSWPKVTTCPSCGKSARPIHKRMFPPDPDRVFCRFCGEEVKLVTNRLTNGDKLRAMSDEELATHFALKQPCPHDRFCGDYDCNSFEDCHDCWLDWLKADAKEK